MRLIHRLCDICDQRVQKYGAQYTTFGLFGVINYPLALSYEYFAINSYGFTLRIVATALCFILLLRNKWPDSMKRYLSLYWYVTITLSIPVLTSYLLFKNNLSLGWLVNFNTGALVSILVLDTVSFLIVELIGIAIGVGCFYLLGNSIEPLPNPEHLSVCAYGFFCTILLGSIFSRSREAFHDIVQSRLEDAVRQRTEELQEALAFKTEYLNNMSHEIRTPVHGFVNFSSILIDQWKTLTDTQKFDIATQVYKNAERLRNLVSNLLDLSKHSAGKWVLSPTTFNVKDLVAEIVDEAENLYAVNKNIKINWHSSGASKLYNLVADRELIGQVVRNIFANAIKFSPNDSAIDVTLNIEPSKVLDEESHYIHFSLKDSGVGIPPNELEDIFEPFTQSTKTKAHSGGTGLGLAIAKKVIERHSGKIWAENNQNAEGSTFHFTIPIKYDMTDAVIEHEQPKVVVHDILDERSTVLLKKTRDTKKTILLIDDEDTVRSSMQLILENAGYTMQSVTSAVDGINYAKANFWSIDLIVLDLMIPDLSGIDTLRIIKHNKHLSNIPVILHTGVNDPEMLKEATELGVKTFLSKPSSSKEILKIINAAISSKS